MGFFNYQDAIKLTSGNVVVTIAGRNYNIIEAEEVNAKVTLNKEEQMALGRTFKGHKVTSLSGAGTLNVKHVSSMWSKAVETFKNKGTFPEMSITGTMDDPTSSAGKQVVKITGVIPDEITLFTLGASDGIAMNEMGFTFEDYAVTSAFKDIKR